MYASDTALTGSPTNVPRVASAVRLGAKPMSCAEVEADGRLPLSVCLRLCPGAASFRVGRRAQICVSPG